MMMVDGIWREEKCERWNLELGLGVKTVGEGRCNTFAIVKQSLLWRARPLGTQWTIGLSENRYNIIYRRFHQKLQKVVLTCWEQIVPRTRNKTTVITIIVNRFM